MKNFIICLSAVFVSITSCIDLHEKPVIITKDYVINPNWDEQSNSFDVCRMKLKDSTKIISLEDPSEPELYHGLIEDSIHSFTANVKYNGVDYANRKVYFDKFNGFYWRKANLKSDITYKTIGKLQRETWYLLMGLSNIGVLHYIYIDNLDSLHIYKVSTMTNI